MIIDTSASKRGLPRKDYERPFAYEFYHQPRLLSEPEQHISASLTPEQQALVQRVLAPKFIHCELLKTSRGLPKYPDLLVHHPGHDLSNLAAVEIKVITNRVDRPGVQKDLKTLRVLRNRLGYAPRREGRRGHELGLDWRERAVVRCETLLNTPNTPREGFR